MKNKKAFTLIELMVVVAIIGVLATLGIANYTSAVRKGRDAKQKSDISQIQQALVMYRADRGGYPQTTAWASELTSNGYLNQVPEGPAGRVYTYTANSCSAATGCKDFDLCTGELEAAGQTGANSSGNTMIPCTGTYCKYYCVTSP